MSTQTKKLIVLPFKETWEMPFDLYEELKAYVKQDKIFVQKGDAYSAWYSSKSQEEQNKIIRTKL